MVFIHSSFFKKTRTFFIQSTLLSILFFLHACRKAPVESFYDLSSDEREHLTTFFQELLFDHYGAYTLLGDKPITIESLYTIEKTDADKIQQYISNHPELAIRSVERNLEETWKVFQKIHNKFLITDYVLAEIKLPNTPENVSDLLFINIKATALVMQKHYEDFKRAYGKDFHPLEVIYQLKEGKTDFWEKVLPHYSLLGILLGYGYNNAYLFEWFMTTSSPALQFLHANSCTPENTDPLLPPKFTIANKALHLPCFVCLDPETSKKLIKKYEKSRMQILKKYRNRNFLEVTLDELTK